VVHLLVARGHVPNLRGAEHLAQREKRVPLTTSKTGTV
jgi:hypothetical protein